MRECCVNGDTHNYLLFKTLKHNLRVESQVQCGKTAQFSDTENVTEANSVLAVDEEPYFCCAMPLWG